MDSENLAELFTFHSHFPRSPFSSHFYHFKTNLFNRKGAEVDSENLAELFTQLGFKVKSFFKGYSVDDPTLKDILPKIEWVLTPDLYEKHFSPQYLIFQVETHLNLGRNDTFRVLIDFAARSEHKDADMVHIFLSVSSVFLQYNGEKFF